MSLNLQEKQAVVAEVAKQVAGAQAIVMAENRGMLDLIKRFGFELDFDPDDPGVVLSRLAL